MFWAQSFRSLQWREILWHFFRIRNFTSPKQNLILTASQQFQKIGDKNVKAWHGSQRFSILMKRPDILQEFHSKLFAIFVLVVCKLVKPFLYCFIYINILALLFWAYGNSLALSWRNNKISYTSGLNDFGMSSIIISNCSDLFDHEAFNSKMS